MRKSLIVLAVVFAASLYTAVGVQAAKCPTMKSARPQVKASIKAKPKAKCHRVSVVRCPKKHKVRKASPAQAARGPVVNCPAPVVNVPQQPAPVVNIPQQPAPVVNVPAAPPTVGITVDDCSIFIVRENTLTVLDKNTYEVKKTVQLQ